MAIKYSVAVRDARLEAVESTVGASAKLKLFTGSTVGGTLLATLSLPSDWMAAASGGTKAMLGTWSATASGSGTAGHFGVYATDGTTLGMEGSVTATGGGGDLELDNVSITSGQTVAVASFTLTAGNA